MIGRSFLSGSAVHTPDKPNSLLANAQTSARFGPRLGHSSCAHDATGQAQYRPKWVLFERHIMTVARITEISSVSKVSFEDAILQGVERANKTLKNVKGAWVKDQEVTVDNGKVSGYKVILKVTFILAD